jgi:hypothetical protein
VHGDDLITRDSQQPERVVVPQILLAGGRQAGEIVDAHVRSRRDAGGPQPASLQAASGQQPVDQPAQPLLLQGAQLLRRHGLLRWLEHRRRRIIIKSDCQHGCRPSL